MFTSNLLIPIQSVYAGSSEYSDIFYVYSDGTYSFDAWNGKLDNTIARFRTVDLWFDDFEHMIYYRDNELVLHDLDAVRLDMYTPGVRLRIEGDCKVQSMFLSKGCIITGISDNGKLSCETFFENDLQYDKNLIEIRDDGVYCKELKPIRRFRQFRGKSNES